MDGPQSLGFSPEARCISSTSSLASERRAGSVRASMNAPTLRVVALVLFSGILASVSRRKASIGGKQIASYLGLMPLGATPSVLCNQTSVTMRFSPGQASTEFTFLPRRSTTRRTPDRLYLFESAFLGLHICR